MLFPEVDRCREGHGAQWPGTDSLDCPHLLTRVSKSTWESHWYRCESTILWYFEGLWLTHPGIKPHQDCEPQLSSILYFAALGLPSRDRGHLLRIQMCTDVTKRHHTLSIRDGRHEIAAWILHLPPVTFRLTPSLWESGRWYYLSYAAEFGTCAKIIVA